MRKILILLFAFSSAFGQMTAYSPDVINRRQPVAFSHIPFILLRVNPSAMLGYNNTLEYGVELAPPFGKFSFTFDYGSGKGSWNTNKYVKEFQPDNKNREFKGEIRAYFSDWYPFYALDKKPFGRYYSLEYINGKYERNLGIPVTWVGGMSPEEELRWYKGEKTEQTHVLHVKYGKHIHLHKHLFLDVYGGLGMGLSLFSDKDGESIEGEFYSPVKLSYLSNRMYEKPKSNKYFFSKTLGLRIVVPI